MSTWCQHRFHTFEESKLIGPTLLDDVRAVEGMSRLRLLKHWDRGFESHSRRGCLYAFFSVFVLFCVQVAALQRADPPSKGSCRLYVG
jgi:hypothetical protein